MTGATKRRAIPGSGEDCECGEHRAKCTFGRAHFWMMGYVPEAAHQNLGVDLELARRGSMLCVYCRSVHVGEA